MTTTIYKDLIECLLTNAYMSVGLTYFYLYVC